MQHDIRLSAAVLMDAGARQERLEHVARLTAAKYWRRPSDEDWARAATFLFRTASEWVYAAFPIYRRRYYAVVRIAREDTNGNGAVRSDMFDVRGIAIFEADVLLLACQELSDDLA
jgi:hypothetical protein